MSFSESTLIYQLQLRNERAFNFLYDSYSAALFGLIKRMIKCELTSEEILQNVFLKSWLNIEKYSSEKGSLFTWMYSITRHEIIDYLRSKEVKKRGLTVFVTEIESKETSCTYRHINSFDLLRSLSLLDPKERIIIELFSSGFTCKEIGQMVCQPEGSVKTKMRSIYKTLRSLLAWYQDYNKLTIIN